MHYIQAIRPFLDGLKDNWLWLIGLALMAEPLLDSLWEGYRDRADRYVSRKIRTRVSWAIVVVCGFVAVFLTFADQVQRTQVAIGERNEARRITPPSQQPTIDRLSADLEAARGQIDTQKQQINQQQGEIASQKKEIDSAQQEVSTLRQTYARRKLTDDEKKIIAQVSKSPPDEKYSVSIYQPSDCDDCDEYSTDFIETLTAPEVGWKVVQFTTMHGGVNPHFRGVALLVKDPQNPPHAAIALANALAAAKIKFVPAKAQGLLGVENADVGMLIGPREGQ